MSFSGAPNVIHVKPGGGGTQGGQDWTNAAATPTAALSLVPASGNALILIAPGHYVGVNARATITKPNIRFQGAGPGTVLEENDQNAAALIQIAANNIEFSDLTLINSSASTDGIAILNGNPTSDVRESLRITRCYVKGQKAIQAQLIRKIILQESMIEGTRQALLFGNLQETAAELYVCIAFNTDFRAVIAAAADSQTVVADGGAFTAMNCNITTIAPSSGSNRYAGVRIDHGGQVVLASCEASVSKGGAATVHVGVDIAGTAARMNLTGRSVFAKGGNSSSLRAISPKIGDSGYDANRMQAHVSLLTPNWPT